MVWRGEQEKRQNRDWAGNPKRHHELSIELQKPVGLEPGMRFAIREGSKTVGAGIVLHVE
jgi:elongation factor Tu